MNNLLKQLGDKAGVCPIRHVGGGEWDSYLPEAEQKFAELIIEECCKALTPMLRDMISRGQGVAIIKEHFGVKE